MGRQLSPLERQFLPAAQEIIDTPASPAGRAVALTICAAFALGLIWAILGQVEIVATAQGRTLPRERVKLIQPLEAGLVRAIHVEDGDAVAEGAPLLELDPTETGADTARLGLEQAMAALDSARLTSLLDDAEPVWPEGADPALLALQTRLLAAARAAHQARLSGLDGQLAQRRAERATLDRQAAKLAATLPLARERFDTRQYLAEEGHGSKLLALEEQQRLVEMEEDLAIARARMLELDSAIEALARGREEAEAEFRRQALTDLTEARRRAEAAGAELTKANERLARRTLLAPIAGRVQQLAVHTVGGVVTPAQTLMVIVPDAAELEVEALVENRDIGFVHEGQAAEIKLDAFPFTRYGVLHGKVVSLSRDSAPLNPAMGAGASDGPAPARLYTARVALDRASIRADGKDVPLSPGMSAAVEIQTGRRRLIEFLLAPLFRMGDEAMRER